MKKLYALAGLLFVLSFSSSAAAVPAWQGAINTAIANGNFSQINIIAASNPTAEGDIAAYLLKLVPHYANQPGTDIKIFEAATPFVGLIAQGNSNNAATVIAAMLAKATDPAFQRDNSRGAALIFTAALIMSGQPNIILQDPNLHQEVLTAADDFVKSHPQEADKRLLEEVSLAEAGGAPNNQPLVMPVISQ